MLRSFFKISTVSLIALLVTTACTDKRYKREVNGNESYLDTLELQRLSVPEGYIMPSVNPEYEIKMGRTDGFIGKQLDIRPPAQALATIEGSTVEYKENVIIFKTKKDSYSWSQLLNILRLESISFHQLSNAEYELETDYIALSRFDDSTLYTARYAISFLTEGNFDFLLVKVLNLKDQQEEVKEPDEVQRYSVLFFNNIALQLARNEDYIKQVEHVDSIQDKSTTIDVQTGTDESGLPVIFVRTQFDKTWFSIPQAFGLMGIQITKQARSTGIMEVSYNGSINPQLADSGSSRLPIRKGEYTVKFGDLVNRTSLQFSDKSDKYLTDEQNRIIAFVLQDALQKIKK